MCFNVEQLKKIERKRRKNRAMLHLLRRKRETRTSKQTKKAPFVFSHTRTHAHVYRYSYNAAPKCQKIKIKFMAFPINISTYFFQIPTKLRGKIEWFFTVIHVYFTFGGKKIWKIRAQKMRDRKNFYLFFVGEKIQEGKKKGKKFVHRYPIGTRAVFHWMKIFHKRIPKRFTCDCICAEIIRVYKGLLSMLLLILFIRCIIRQSFELNSIYLWGRRAFISNVFLYTISFSKAL